MDLQKAFDSIENRFENGVGTVQSTTIQRNEWLLIRDALVQVLKTSENLKHTVCAECAKNFRGLAYCCRCGDYLL